jgi:integrase
MPIQLLTARTVEAAKPQAKRYEIFDRGCPGLVLVVQPTGTHSFAHRYRRPDGRGAKRTLPAGLSLAEARADVARARDELEGGSDPAPRRLPAIYSETSTVMDVVIARFLDIHVARNQRPNTQEKTEYILNRFIGPAFRGRDIQTIRRRDVIALLDKLADRPGIGHKLQATISSLFHWAVDRDIIQVNPIAGMAAQYPAKARDRVLTDDELRALLLACKSERAHDAAFMVLALTGQRKNEICQMTWDELDAERRELKLKPERSKNNKAHVVPLPRQAWRLIEARPRFADGPYVFSRDGRYPADGWGLVKRQISIAAGLPPESWRLHDLRRTCASGLQRLGVRFEVIERILNHTMPGVAGIYLRHDYADEMQIALQKWGDHVEQLLGGKPAKVVRLRRT